MSRFPSPAYAERINDRIQQLDDGFERLGDQDTPFTLRKGGKSLERAKALHSDRTASERKRDEESNEPVTRELPEWRADMMGLDFPFVDTIPLDEQRARANRIATLAIEENFVEEINRDVEFQDRTVRGKYWRGVQLIEIGTDEEDFPGFREGIVLVHELGHTFYDAWSPDSGIEEGPQLFESEAEQAQARAISERLHGPFIEMDGPFVDYRAGSDEELAAAVFASRIIEPMAAQRLAPDAVRRLEEIFGELSDPLF
jgi:hypothetical protein